MKLSKQTKSNIVRICLLLFTFQQVSCDKQKNEKNEKPNIILIFMDDMGYGDLTSFGAQGYKTPTLDKMAAEGMRFTNFYAAQAICSASRAGVLTGCYPNRIGITGALFPNSSIGLNHEEKTIAEMLKEVGYSTAMVGKWHLGDSREFLPLQHGFDEYLGLPYSNDMWPVSYLGKPLKDSKMPILPLLDGNSPVSYIETLKDQEMLTTRYTERAVSFIERNKEKPFFLYFAHSMPHVPLAVSTKFKDMSGKGIYGDVMMEIDWSVGKILNSLKESKLDDNTLVIFTSDNGPWLSFGNHSGSSGGLREGKQTSWDGGQKVPTIMRWPKTISAGSITNKLAATIDLLPTFAEISGAPLPSKKIDGVSILEVLTGNQKSTPRENFYYYYGKNNLEGVRNGKWKLVLPHYYLSYENIQPGKGGRGGGRYKDSIGFALYNLRVDPGERYNVYESYPEIVNELMGIVEEARQDLGDGLSGRSGSNRRQPGKI